MSKILIVSVCAFAIGFFSNRLLSNQGRLNSTENLNTAQCETLTQAKNELISMSKNDYLEYLQIKDLKQKYEKADELLGRIMLLFLADVGFRTKTVAHSEETSPLKKEEPRPIEEKPQASASDNTNQTLTEPSKPSSKTASNLDGKAALIRNLRSEKQIREALDNAIVENPKVELAQGEVPTQKQSKQLEGVYRGTVRFLDNKRGNLTVVWDLAPDYSKKELSGVFTLSIQGPGKDSESVGRGSIGSIVSLSQDPEGFLVSSCGDECYMQLYYNSSSDRFVGNYYELVKGSKSKFERLGLVQLQR